MTDGPWHITQATQPPAPIVPAGFAVTGGNAGAGTVHAFLLVALAGPTEAPAPVVTAFLAIAAATTAPTAVVTAKQALTGGLADALTVETRILGTRTLATRAAASVVATDLALALGCAFETEGIGHFVGGIQIAEGRVAIAPGAEFFLARGAAVVKAEGIGAGGIRIAIGLDHAGNPSGGVTAQGVALAVGGVVGLALLVATGIEIVAATGGNQTEMLTQMLIFEAPVIRRGGGGREGNLEQEIVNAIGKHRFLLQDLE